MQVYRIDQSGYFIEPVIVEYEEEIPEDCIETRPPDGLFRARWTGEEWIEDMPQEEIEAILNRPRPPTTEELIMLAVAELDTQRELDKTEIQLAIADLANTLLGGNNNG